MQDRLAGNSPHQGDFQLSNSAIKVPGSAQIGSPCIQSCLNRSALWTKAVLRPLLTGWTTRYALYGNHKGSAHSNGTYSLTRVRRSRKIYINVDLWVDGLHFGRMCACGIPSSHDRIPETSHPQAIHRFPDKTDLMSITGVLSMASRRCTWNLHGGSIAVTRVLCRPMGLGR